MDRMKWTQQEIRLRSAGVKSWGGTQGKYARIWAYMLGTVRNHLNVKQGNDMLRAAL